LPQSGSWRLRYKEQAAVAYGRSARLNHVNAVCNYASPVDADEAIIPEANQINGLRNAGFMSLIMEGYGPAKHEEALQRVWRRWCRFGAGMWLRII
jgi:hypothetical protein